MSRDERRHAAVRNLEHEIGTLLRRIRKGLVERATHVHPDLNPTSYLILSAINEHGARRAADLAEMFALDKGSVSRVVHQLLALGLIARSPDPDDGRASILTATDDAVRRLRVVRDQHREHFGIRLDGWGTDEIDELVAGLDRLNQTLSGHAPATAATRG